MKHLEVSFGMNYLSIENINVVLAGSILLGSKAKIQYVKHPLCQTSELT